MIFEYGEKNMKRILLTILLASVITLGALPASPAFARTDEGAVQNDSGGGAAASQEDRDSSAVRYIERHEDGSEEELDAPDDATVYSGQDWLYSGWVIVDKSRTLDDRLGIQGNVKLILCDGVTLTVTKGVRVPESSTLTIYGQKNDSGKLVATGNSYNAGIGSNDADDGHETAAGTIIIHGGNIEATGGSDAAGIGGGNESSGGHVRIYGGTVKATGGTWAAGIGSGDEAVRSGSFTMYGGTVTAHGGTDGAGVGGGNEVDGSVVQIYGGTLKATGDRHAAGIGGGDQGDGLSFIMHGGKVTASTGQYGAGIGGGEEGDGGTVVIYAGKVTASGNEGGAGIGGGSEGNGGDVTINGGTVTATGSKWGAGIGGGYKGDSGTVTINDGKVTARCSGHPYRGAGIGSGSDHDQGGTITINGGHVKAYSTNGAGIGGAYEGDGGTIKITGGLVNAKSESGAGIGGGGSFGVGGGGDGGTTTISGGVVIAVSTQKGAGIGGGEDGDGGSVTISGGHVTASGGYFDYDYWQANMSPDYSEFLKNWSLGDPNSAIAGFIMDIIFSGEYGGAGIGGGDDGDGANVKITGGTVIATAGLSTARAIGHGNDNSGNGTLRIYDGAKVTCGSLSGSTVVLDENPVPAGQRESKPHDRPFAMIEPCDHPNGEIENAGESGHRVDCTYCGYAGELVPHQFDESGLLCPQCGYERVLVTFLPGGGSGEMEPAYVEKGGSYTLPASTFTAPEDSSFTGWKGSVNGGEEDVYPAGRSVVLTENLTLTAQWADPYKVWVGETRVTSINKDDVLGDGKVSYDPSTCTLHFDGVESISGLHNSTLVYAEGMDLTLTGSAVLTRSSSFGRCVHVESGSLTIDGDFTMTGAGLNAVNAGRDVILAGGSIKAEAVRFGIRAGRTLYIQNTITRVESDGSKAFNYDEIEVGDALLVTEYTQAEESNSLSLLRKDPIEIKDANHIVLERGVKVTFVLNNGTMNGQTGTVERLIEPGLVEEPDPAPTREGYTFGGWYTDVERTEEHKFKFDSTELLLDQRLYANWTKVWTVEKDWLIDVAEDAPEMVEVYLLKQNKNGTWDEVTSIILNEDVDWEGSFTVSTGAAEIDTKHYRIREKDHYEAMIYDASDDAFFDEQPTAYFQVNGQKVGFIAKYEMNEETGHMTITNATMKIYSVELTWDIDLGDQDRPDEIEIALQKKEGKFSYSTIQVIKVSRENNWSGQFEPVPIGQMDENGQLDPYSYRVREVRPFQEGEEEVQDDPNDEEAHRRYLESADKRIVHDKYDFDKPYIKNLIKIFDPKDLVSADLTLDWLKKQATKVAIPVPTFTAHIYQYTDTFDKEIAEHDTKYHVKYDHNSSTHKMSITDTAVLDINIYKRWLFFEEEDMPESVYLMLMSKIQDDYAEQMGVDQENIYTPVMTVVYGSQINLLTIPGAHLDKKMKDGLTSMFGSVVGTVADTAISKIIEKYTKTGIAIAEVKDQHGYNPNSSWRASFGVKKYGGFGVPMDFAGAELVTGFMEMIVDAVIKAAGIPKVNMPIMYHPILKCWSIKGYCFKLPVIDRDYEQTGNVINFKVDWDGDNDNYIHGVKHWVDGGAKDRPTSVTLHLYVKNEDGQDEELSVSKDGKLKVSGSGDDWEWGVQIPLDEIAVYENPDDPENSKVTYKEIRVEEDVPSGYEATYDGYDVTNKKPGIETIEISGQKTWDDNDDAEGKRPSSITIQLLADGKPKTHKKVTAANGWKWTFKDLPKYKNDGKTEIKYTIKENVVKGYETTIDGYNVTNKWTGETPTITIMVNGNSDTKTYNGSEQSFEGTFTASSSDAGFDASKFSYSGDKTASGTNVGDYEVGPDESSCRYDDSDYVIVWEMGDPVKLTIEPAEITITVTGHTDTVDYTGSEQSVEGYDKSCGSDLYDESKVSFDGSDKAKGTNVGTYPMNIDSSDFSYNDDNVNAQFQVTDGWLKISPAVLKIKVTGHTKTVTYNGSEQNVEGYDLSCDNEAFSTNKVVFNGEASAKGTEASDEKYTMGLQASQFSYSDSNLTAEFLVTDGWLKINPVSDKMTVTVTGHSDTVTYNGSEQSVTGYDLSCDDEAFDKNKVSFSGDDTAKGTDAGTYKMGLSASQFSYSDQNAEVTFVVIDGELKIEPAKIVITVNGHTETKTYNGQEQTAEGYDISCSSDLYDESKVSFSGDAVARGTEALDSKYMMELSADQFSYSDSNVSATFEINDGWLKITPATIRIKVTGNTKTKTYDGQEQTAEGYSLSSDDEAFAESKVTFDGEASAKGTDASDEKYMMGLNAMQFSYNDSNYTATFEVTDGWLKIDPAEITVTITGNKDTKEYNGEEQQVEDYEQSCESELYDESKVVFSGEAVAKGTDVNTYPMKLDASQFAYIDSNVNVTFVINDGELEITKKAVTVTITGNKDTKEYNGEEQQVEGYETEIDDDLYTEDDFSFSGEAVAKGTDAGKYPMGLEESQFTNNNNNFDVSFVINDGELEITKKAVTVTITGNKDTKEYNGEEQQAEGYETEIDDSLYTEDDFSFSGEAVAKGTNVGTYPMNLAESQFTNNNNNFDVSFVINDGELEITKRAVTVTITGNKDTKAYNGEEQQVEGYEKEISDSLYKESDFSFSGEAVAKGTEVGTYPMGLKESQFTNNNDNFDATFNVTDGELKITDADMVIKVTGHKDTKVYNSEEQTVEGYDLSCDSELYDENKVSFSGEAVAKGTNVGTYPMGLEAGQFSYGDESIKVEFVITDGELKITKRAVTVTIAGNKDSKVYNGEEQQVEGYETEISDSLYKESDFTFSGEAAAKGTDVDTYQMGLKESQFTNNNDNFDVTFQVTDGELKITKRPVTVTITGHKDTKIYNGKEQKVEGYETEISDSLYKESDFSFSGEAVAKGTNTGTYPMGLAASQFTNNNDNFDATFEIIDGELKITDADMVIKVTGHKDTKVYNGEEQTVEGYDLSCDSELYDESKVSFSDEDVAKGTNVGKYPMGLSADQFSYGDESIKVEFVITDGELKITKRPVTITITGNKDTKVYNGEEQKVEGYETEISDSLYKESDFAFSGEAAVKGTNVDTYPMGLKESQFSNSNDNFDVIFQVTDGELKITKLPVTVTITGNKDSKVYNGEEQKVEGYKTEVSDSLYKESDFTFSGEAVAKGTNVDTYPMGLKESQFTNKNDNFDVTFTVTDGELKITPVEITVKVTGHTDTVVYNGSEQEVEGYDLECSSEWYDKSKVSFNGEAAAKGTDVNTEGYPMNLAADQFSYSDTNVNATFEITDGWLKITKKPVTVTITGHKDTKVYNGEEQKVEGYETEISEPLYNESDFTFSGEAVAKGTNAGTYPMGLKESQFTNNNDNFDATFTVIDGELKITDADLVIKVTGHKGTKVYNGEEQSVEGYDLSCDSALYDESKVSFIGEAIAKGTNVGTYPMGLSADQFSYGDGSIKVEFVVTDGELKITKKPVTVTITGHKDTKVYNGEEQTVEGYETKINDSLYKESDFSFSGEAVAKGTDTGTYPMGLEESQFTNKNDNFDAAFKVIDGELKITDADLVIKVTGHKDSKVYNGEEQQVEGYDLSCDSELYDESKVSFSGEAIAKGTNVGTHPMGLSADQFSYGDGSIRVEFVVTDGELEITPAAITIKVTGHTDTVMYNGSEQKAEGYDLSCDSKLFDESKVSFNGEAAAKGTDVNTEGYPMNLAADRFSYSDTNVTATFEITDGWLKITKLPVTVTITGRKETKTYNGEEQKAEGYDVSISEALYKESDFMFSGEAAAKGTDVGTYPMGLAESQFTNNNGNFDVTFRVTDGELKINPAAITVTVTGHTKTVAYTGSEQSVEGYDLSCGSKLFDKNKVSFSGEAAARGTDVNTEGYPMNLAAGQFSYDDPNVTVTFAVTDGWLKITPAPLTITVNGNADSKVYNGSRQRFAGTFTATSSDTGFDAARFSYSGNTTASGTNVGDYTTDPEEAFCSYSDNRYTVTWVMGDPVRLTITPAEITIEVTGHTRTVIYNGQEQSVEGYDLSCESTLYDASKVSFNGEAVAKGIDVGTYPMGLAASRFSYSDRNVTAAFAVTDGWLKIDDESMPEILTITVSGNADTRVYNGREQTFNGTFTASSIDEGFDPSKFSYSGNSSASGTNVGVYTTDPLEEFCSYDDDRYTVVWVMGDPVRLTITPVNFTIKVVGYTDVVTYNGEEQSVTGYDLSCNNAFYSEEKISFSGEAVAKGTDADTYPMGLDASQFSYNDPNVAVSFLVIDGWLKITPAAITVKVTGHTKIVTYNGEEQSVTGYDLSCEDPFYDASRVVFRGEAVAKGTDADTYPMGLETSQFSYSDPNVTATFAVTDGWLKIEPAAEPEAITITVVGHTKTVTYNGSEQSVTGYEISCDSELFDPSRVVFAGDAAAKGTAVGTYPMGLAASQFSYNDPDVTATFDVTDGWLKIEPAAITITVAGHTDTEVYTGREQSVTGYEISCGSALFDRSRVSFSGDDTAKGTDVGTYPMGLAASQFTYNDPNVTATFDVTDGWLKITPAAITITVTGHTDTRTYNGSEQSVTGYDLACSSALYDEDKVSFSGDATAKGTAVGAYPMGLAASQFRYNDPNVTAAFDVTDGWLKITPASLTIRVTGHTKTVTWTGEEQSVTGYDLSSDSALYDAGKVVFSGDDTAKGTDAGTYPMGLDAAQFSYNDANVTAAFLVTDGWLKIEPVPEPDELAVTVIGHTDIVIYDGSEQSVTGYELICSDERFDPDKLVFTGDAVAKGTNVDTYPMGLAASQFSYDDPDFRVTFSVIDGWLKIEPAAAAVDIIGHTDTVIYNGREQNVQGYGVGTSSALIDPSRIVFNGDAVAKGTNVDTYPMGLAEDQFSYNDPNVTVVFSVTDGWLKILPVEFTVKVTGYTDTVVYNGSEQSVTGYDLSCNNAFYNEEKVVFNGDATAKGTNVDTYPMGLAENQFSYDDPNAKVSFLVADGWLKITPASLTIEVTGHTAIVTYNGKEQSVTGYEISCGSPLYDANKVVFSGEAVAKGTNAGTYPMGMETAQFSYNDTNVTATFAVTDGWLKIEPATGPDALRIFIIGHTDTVVYSGKEQSVTGYEISCSHELFDLSKVVFSGDDTAKGTAVGTYPMGLDASQFSYNDPNLTATFEVTDGWLKIEPAELAVTVTGHTDIVSYTGYKQSVTGYDLNCDSELFDPYRVSFSGDDTAKGTDVGTYPMGLAEDQFSYTDPNVKATFAVTDGWLKIEPALIVITVDGNADIRVYSGEEQTFEGEFTASCSDAGFDAGKFSYSGKTTASGTGAGVYTTPPEEEFCSYSDPNYQVVWVMGDPVRLTIVPVILRVTIVGLTDIVSYTGFEQSVEGYGVGTSSAFFDPANVSFSGEAVAKGIDVGTYPMGLGEEQFSYSDLNVIVIFRVYDGWLEIVPVPDPATITITVNGNAATKVYNGSEQSFAGMFTAASSDAGFDVSKFGYSGSMAASGTNVGVYTTAPEEAFCSYSDPDYTVIWVMGDPVKLTITPAEITITVTGHTDTVTYTGSEQSVTGYELACGSLLFDAGRVSFSGEAVAKGTDPGTYPMGLAKEQFSYSDPNVTAVFEVTDGWLKIDPVPGPATITITVNGNAATKVYNGSEQSFAGTFTASSSDEGFDVSKFSYSGSMTASGINVGVYATAPEEAFCSYSDPDYTVIWVMGDPVKLTITPAEITITVTGHTDTVVYTGSEQSVTGYDLTCGSALFDAGRVSFSGEAVAKGTAPDTYPMGLLAAQFSYSDPNVTAVFEITDGWLKIEPMPGPVEEFITVSGVKTWVDSDNAAGKRPESITIRLYADGEEIGSRVVTEADGWAWCFEDLPKYAEDGAEIVYTVAEDAVEDYESAVDGYNVTNTYVPKTYLITYDLNGGTYQGEGGFIYEVYPEGTVISIHEAPVREGYIFLYWKGSEYLPGDQYTVLGDHVFVAQWEAVEPVPPKTADDSRFGLWVTLMGSSFLGLCTTAACAGKKNRKRQK